MCRMFGVIGRNPHQKIIECVDYLKAGGPDEQNIRFLRAGLLGHTRLSINGLLNGSQPYALDGVHCVFVGEIYNHREEHGARRRSTRALLLTLGIPPRVPVRRRAIGQSYLAQAAHP